MNLPSQGARSLLRVFHLGRRRRHARVDKHADYLRFRHELSQQLQLLRPECAGIERRTRDVAAWPVKACDENIWHRIEAACEHDWNRARRCFGLLRGTASDNYGYLTVNQIGL